MSAETMSRRTTLGAVLAVSSALGATAFMSRQEPQPSNDPDAELLELQDRYLEMEFETEKAIDAINTAETEAEEEAAEEAFEALSDRHSEEQSALEARAAAIGTASTVAGAAALLRFGLAISGYGNEIADYYIRGERDAAQLCCGTCDKVVWQALMALDRLAGGTA